MCTTQHSRSSYLPKSTRSASRPCACARSSSLQPSAHPTTHPAGPAVTLFWETGDSRIAGAASSKPSPIPTLTVHAKAGKVVESGAGFTLSLDIPKTVGLLRARLATLLFLDEVDAPELDLILEKNWQHVEEVKALSWMF